jgi:hypothetical protein
VSKSHYRNGDLLVLAKSGGKVHIVWTDKKYDVRICRPSMLVKATDPPLKQDVSPRSFKHEVEKQGKRICEECLALCPEAR